MNALFALLPIVLLVYLLTKRNSLASHRALWITVGVKWFLSLAWFNRGPVAVHAAVLDGFLTSWTPITIIWGAIFLFESLETGGGMAVLRRWLNGISRNRVAQLMIVGWAFPFFIEGASGFGTPAALAAPILVGLGFNAVPVAIMSLIMNSVPVSFGAVGTPTWFGFSGIAGLTATEITAIGVKSALIHSTAALFVPVAALLFVIDRRTIRRNLGYIYLTVLATVIPYALTAAVSYEFPSLVGGFTGLVASVYFARRGWGLQRDGDATAAADDPPPERLTDTATPDLRELVGASFPLWGTVIVLLATRIPQLGIKALLTSTAGSIHVALGTIGTITVSPSLVVGLSSIFGTGSAWTHQLLYVPSIVPFVLVSVIYLHSRKNISIVWSRSIDRMRQPALTLFAALIFVNLMMLDGDRSAVAIIGGTLANITGSTWQLFAAFLGAIGSFFSGSNTVSNLTFGAIQDTAARDLGLNRTTILALQSVGGALGNMICINNIVAVSSVLGLRNQEGYIIKRTIRVAVPYAVLAGLFSYLFAVI